MRAYDGPMPRRAPGWPLAATLGAHLLLAWFWLAGTTRRPEIEDPAERVFSLLPVPRPQPASPPPTPSRPSEMRAPPKAPPPADRAAEAIPIQQPQTQRFPEAYDDPLAERRDSQVPDAPDSGMAAQARRQAGPADHALRQGTLAPLTPTTRWQRVAERLEAAHEDSSRTLASESYTTPDGVTIYRFRRGGKVYCRTGGSVRPMPSALDHVRDRGGAVQFDSGGGEGSAGLIPCPRYAAFKRD